MKTNSRLQKLRALAERPGTAAEGAAAWAAYYRELEKMRKEKPRRAPGARFDADGARQHAATDAQQSAAYWEQYLRSRLGKTLAAEDVQKARDAWQRKSDELHQTAGPQQYYYYTSPQRKKAAPQQGRGDDRLFFTLLVVLALLWFVFWGL